MADGSLTITLDDETARRLEAAAQAAGAHPDAYVRRLIDEALESDRWNVARERLAEYRRTGESMPIEEAFDRLEIMVAERRSNRK